MRNTLDKNRVSRSARLFTLAKEKMLFLSIFILSCLIGTQRVSAQQELKRKTTTGTESWTVPAGVTKIEVRVWGAGGRGGSRTTGNNASGGGGGGAFSSSVIAVVPNTSYNLNAGAGSTNNNNSGEDSWFSPSTVGNAIVLAKGGGTVANDVQNGALGGLATGGTGTTKFNGGNGADRSSTTNAGGGGSSASFSGIGISGSGNSGGIAPAEGGNGGNGRNASSTGNGLAGTSPGGGGGGGVRASNGNGTGGNGGNGQVVILALNSDVSLTQAISNNSPVVGSNVTFTLTIKNNGPIDVTNVNVADNLPSGFTLVSGSTAKGSWSAPNWNVGSLTNGETAVLTITATVKPTGSYVNATTMTLTQENSNAALGASSLTVVPNFNTDIVLGQTVDSLTPIAGGNVTFNLKVTNNGPLAATGVSVANVLSNGLTLVSATPSGSTTWTSPNWTIGNLAVDAFATLTIVAKVNPTGVYTNSASVTFAEPDGDLSNNQHSITLYPKIPTTNLQITNEVDQATPVVASAVNFTLTAYNGGPDNASNVVVNNLLPNGFTVTGHTGGAGYDPGTGIWTIGALNKGTTATLTITATVKAIGNYLSTATISGNETDPFTDNNASEALVNPSYIETTIVLPFSVTTYDLSSYAVNNLPAGSASSWHTAAVATAANKYTGSLTAVSEGTYYLAFYDSTQDCYSLTTKIIIKKTAGSLFISNPMIYQRIIKTN